MTPAHDFTIRKAESNDISSIAYINAKSWQSTYRGIIAQSFLETITPEQQLSRARRLVESSELHCIVAEHKQNSMVVGFACFGRNREPKIEADSELQAIYLLEEYQGAGIGRMLFNFGVIELKTKSMQKMMVSVFEDNKLARSFYERLGGVQIENDHVDLAGVRYRTLTYIWSL